MSLSLEEQFKQIQDPSEITAVSIDRKRHRPGTYICNVHVWEKTIPFTGGVAEVVNGLAERVTNFADLRFQISGRTSPLHPKNQRIGDLFKTAVDYRNLDLSLLERMKLYRKTVSVTGSDFRVK